ncbi:glycosyltransferase family 4 protein [Planosporangium thailandense]|uniref:Glycosyltransferase family 4 protein n=1 Tax=Planosporangium thailandense TaxID=765197 RepID=A0ABX0XYS5_9ACTN|nr:glycosyltransferase family 4 protein [Planosporangium thailandense]
MGSFAYESNIVGLRRFLRNGWEKLRRSGFSLTLIGSGLSAHLKRNLQTHDGVTTLGFVEDLRPILSSAYAAVVPLWSGAGVKLKTLTLLAHGVPVFSTSCGAEGIPQTDGIQIRESPEELAEAIISSSSSDLERMSVSGAELAAAEFSEDAFQRKVNHLLADHIGLRCGVDLLPWEIT